MTRVNIREYIAVKLKKPISYLLFKYLDIKAEAKGSIKVINEFANNISIIYFNLIFSIFRIYLMQL